jgi:SNF2 family DNA or RNA helicase
MIVLHGAIADGGFVVWGEKASFDAPEESAPASRDQNPAGKGQNPPFHPFSAGGAELAQALRDSPAGLGVTVRRVHRAVLWLPSRAGAPLASGPLVAPPAEAAGFSSGPPVLAPWTVAACPLRIGEAVDFLCAAMGRRTLAPGVAPAQDIATCVHLLRFAGSLVARQLVLPTVAVSARECRALWEPVLTGKEAGRMQALAAALPPSARALAPDAAGQAPPETPAMTVAKAFVTECVDYLVRKGSAGTAKSPGKAKEFESLHDAWLAALEGENGTIKGKKPEILQLAAQVGRWRRPMRAMAASPYRLVFRLEEPEGGQGENPAGAKWSVRYLLSLHDDPSLPVSVEDALSGRVQEARALARPGAGLPEYILSSLGQAAGICPHVAESLKTAKPGGYQLDTAGAYEFLTRWAGALELAGFGVLFPSWWTRRGTRARLSARAAVTAPKLRGSPGLSLATMVRFEWDLSLGGEQCTLQELLALANIKAPLVEVRGQWVEMDPEKISEAIRFLKSAQSRKASVKDLVAMAIGARQPARGIEFEGVSADGWVRELLDQLAGVSAYSELEPPKNFEGTLRPYQVRGYSWLAFLRRWGFGACLADDMGLGKTIQTLALVARDWAKGERRPVLLVCPTSVVANWQKEAARFTPELPVYVHHGVARKKGAPFKRLARKHAMVISSYGLIQRDLKFLRDIEWAGVVLDEAQNIKNPETKQAKAAKALKPEYKVALTGTPVENNVGDLWSIMDFLNPGFLGTQTAFKRNFFVPIQAEGDTEASRKLSRITGPFILRRLKTDKTIITDLPEKMETRVYCTLTREQASLYAAVLADLETKMSGLEGIERKGLILATLSKLKQVCNHPAQFLGDNSKIHGRSGKVARLAELLSEILENREKALVFTQFSTMGAMLQKHLQAAFGEEALFLHGQVAKERRDEMVERFQNPSGNGPRIFILSLRAGGTGLNLTAANHVFHFDRWWNPAVENQATDRAFRIGQKKNVQVHKFNCIGTLEDKIDTMIEQKKEVADKVVGTGEGWLCQLSDEELREVFALRRESVGE